ncbi:MAG: hypothetical protein HQ549_03340 [Candidatus Omnitrophica bacterium]|nr:hypothetical protein [Candidatus Omnitrophota bacterium]
MRELIFKNLTAIPSKKRDISLEEIVHRNGIISTTKKRSMYFVREIHKVKSKKELAEWIHIRKKNGAKDKKFFHILRKCSSAKKEDKLICKMRGTFYIVADVSIYNIVFVHTIKINIKNEESAKCI